MTDINFSHSHIWA